MREIIVITIFLIMSIVAMLLMKRFTGKKISIILTGVVMSFPLFGALLPPGTAGYFFQKWGNIFFGFLLYFMPPLLIVGFVLMGIRLRRKIKRHDPPEFKKIYITATVLLLVLSLGLNIYGTYHAKDIQITKYDVKKETVNIDKPMRIVLIADLHIGVNSDFKMFEDMVKKVNSQKPDLILVGGDIVNSAFGALKTPDKYAALFKKMKARCGTYAIYGNHDVDEPLLGGFTIKEMEDSKRNPKMPKFLKDCGWKLLTDEHVTIPELDGLVLVGRRDDSRPGEGLKARMSLQEVMKGISPEKPILMLQHEPLDLEQLSDYGIDINMSGHTHDGQVFPGNIYARMKSPQAYDIMKWKDTTSIVTSGVGFYGPPIRVGTISEIVVLDLN